MQYFHNHFATLFRHFYYSENMLRYGRHRQSQQQIREKQMAL